MVIWTRWGILGLLIPTALIVIALIGTETIAKQRMREENQKPAKPAQVADDAEEAPPEDPKEVKAAERKRAAEREKMTKRVSDTGYLLGGIASAAILWPLGRWMNKSESGGLVEQQVGGGHTMFFIPLEYWGFIWAAIGLFKFFGN